jgi:hypothetical protein
MGWVLRDDKYRDRPAVPARVVRRAGLEGLGWVVNGDRRAEPVGLAGDLVHGYGGGK